MPSSIAARMIEVPSGTVTAAPSMVSVTVVLGVSRGRAVVGLLDERHDVSSIRRLAGAARRAEIFGEMGERAHHRIRREAAQRAQRSELHRVAEIVQQLEVVRRGPRPR